MARVRQRQRELDEVNAALVVVLPEPAAQIAPLARKQGWPGPALGDPDRGAYRAYSLVRLPWYRVFTVKTLLQYAGLLLRGRFPQQRGQDVMQQGGDFIVDGQGIVRFAHAGRSPDDRPRVDDLMRCLKALLQPPARG